MAGIIASGPETTTYTPPQTFAGSGEIRTYSEDEFTASLNLPALTPIARLASTGRIVAWTRTTAEPATGAEIAIGITCEAVNTTGGVAKHPYYISGDFNIDAINWPEDTTAAEKAVAFERTQITVRKLK